MDTHHHSPQHHRSTHLILFLISRTHTGLRSSPYHHPLNLLDSHLYIAHSKIRSNPQTDNVKDCYNRCQVHRTCGGTCASKGWHHHSPRTGWLRWHRCIKTDLCSYQGYAIRMLLFSCLPLTLLSHTRLMSMFCCFVGIVFDVSKKAEVYGPSGSYHIFAGKDGSKGLGLSSLKPEDAISDYSSLSPEHLKVLDDWVILSVDLIFSTGFLAWAFAPIDVTSDWVEETKIWNHCLFELTQLIHLSLSTLISFKKRYNIVGRVQVPSNLWTWSHACQLEKKKRTQVFWQSPNIPNLLYHPYQDVSS